MIWDTAIIGRGPAGLSAGIYARRAGLSVVCFERNVHGGQIINTPEVENYPALGKISGVEYAMNIYDQAVGFGVQVEYKPVTKVELSGDEKKLYCGDEVCTAKTVIIATGVTRRKLEIPGEDRLTGSGVSYCATCDGSFFKNRVVAVVGGGNTALEDAVYLSGLAEKVFLIHRRDSFRGTKAEQDKVLKNEKIEILYDTIPLEIKGNGKVEGLLVRNVKTGEERTLFTSAVFVAVGLIPHNEMFRGQVNLTPEGYIDSGESCVTNIPGVFVAGDTRKKSLRQLVTATCDGAVAATAAAAYVG